MKEWLPAGAQIAHYEISSRLSASGAGEVYLAYDLDHNREVALKLLPAELINYQSRREHFLRVIKTVAAIRHPYICAVYEGGVTEQGRPFVAMEYVAGQSLDLMIFGPQLSVAQAVAMAIQTAETLDTLHARGWLHLAIKPSNLMLTPARQLKILDTGLALAFPLSLADEGMEPLRIGLGAARYLSPEQAAGEQVDRRADVFSIGAVLYELIAGRTPFAGASVDEVLAAITLAPPPSLTELRDDVSPELERVVMKALAKDADARYQTAGELAYALRNPAALDQPQARHEEDETFYAPEPRAEQRGGRPVADLRGAGRNRDQVEERPAPGSFLEDLRRAWQGLFEGRGKNKYGRAGRIELLHERSFLADLIYFCRAHWHRLLAGLLALIGVTVAMLILHNFLTRAPRGDETATHDLQITPLVTRGNVTDAAISSDGTQLVYVTEDGAQRSLWLKELRSEQETRLASGRGVEYRRPIFAPDGRAVYFVKTNPDDERGELCRVAARGGAEERLGVANIISAVSFAPDGQRLGFITASSDGAETALQIRNDNGALTTLATRRSPSFFAPGGLAWSPDGRVIACVAQDANSDLLVNLIAVNIGNVNGNAERTVVADRWAEIARMAWLSDGGLIVAASEPAAHAAQLWRVSYPTGNVARLVQDASDYRSASLTADGQRLVSVQREALANLWIAPKAGEDLTQITTDRFDGVDGLAWTPDEQLVYTALFNGRSTLRLIKPDGQELRYLPASPEGREAGHEQLAVSPDGRSLVFAAAGLNGARLWRTSLEGDDFKRLTDERLALFPQFAPDGQTVVYSTLRGGRATLARISPTGGAAEELSAARAWRAVFAPDGSKLAVNYRDETSGRWKLAVFPERWPANGDAPLAIFDAPGAHQRIVRWTTNSAGLSYVITRDGVSNIWLQPLDGGAPQPLTHFNAQRIFNFAWSRQGQLAVARGWTTSNVVLIQNFK